MAEDTGLERTEPASARRREEAREQGQVVHSRELSTLALLLAGGGGLWFLGAGISDRLLGLVRHGMELDRALAFAPSLMLTRLKETSVDMLLALSPLLLLFVLAAIASTLPKCSRCTASTVVMIAACGRTISTNGVISPAWFMPISNTA